jgi:hypothetical protein
VGLPLTRAERSGYTETSRYADVVAFLDSLRALAPTFVFGVMGRTAQGRDIPYVIASRLIGPTRQEATRLRRPVVYVQGNIHAGEVEGKEVLQMLLRDLAVDQRPNVLDSIVLIAVPIYNVDGNEAVGPQEQNRPEQNGPAIVGGRATAAELNLNRDYVKAEAPETRASLGMFNTWDPDVFVDLHTTNGSLHGYALTYAPPLNPAAPLGHHTRQWLSVLRQRMRDRWRFETFDYGNFGTDDTPWEERLVYTPRVHAWSTFDSRPRFSTNYYGLRRGIAILSEGYSHDPFERRVASTYAFVREILSLAAEQNYELSEWRHAADFVLASPTFARVPISATLTTTPATVAILVEEIERVSESVRTEPGLPAGLRRTGRFRPIQMPVYDRFDAARVVRPPYAYIIPERMSNVVENLRLHGITVERLRSQWFGPVEEFLVDSISRGSRPFEGHRETRVSGRWAQTSAKTGNSDWFVGARGSLSRLIVYLLEPESDDGLVNWNFFDAELAVNARYPVMRVHEPTEEPRR